MTGIRARLGSLWRRRPQLSLRWRVAVTFGLVSVALAAVIATVTWRLASQYMVDQRVQRATLQATVTAQTLRDNVGQSTDPLTDLMANLTTDPDTTILIGGDDGWVVAGRPIDPDALPESLRAPGPDAHWTLLDVGGSAVLAVALPSGIENSPVFVELFELVEYDRTRQFLVLVSAGGVVASGLIGVGIGWWASRRALRPLTVLTRAAGRVAAGDLSARLPDQGDPDLAPIADAFNRTAADLQERVRRDTRFAGDVSHELRTPLTTMVNAVEVLGHRRDTLDPVAGQAVDLLAAEILRFRVMVVDLLEISRADQDMDDQDAEPVDLGELVRRVAASVPGVPDPEVESPSPLVRGDRRRLLRVLANLLDNARRHAGGVDRVAVLHRSSMARIEVDDRGPGVPAEYRQQVFERFTRIRGTGDDGGSGLGLALVARHVQRHQGSAWVEDRPGGGARFVVEIPCSAVSDDGGVSRPPASG